MGTALEPRQSCAWLAIRLNSSRAVDGRSVIRGDLGEAAKNKGRMLKGLRIEQREKMSGVSQMAAAGAGDRLAQLDAVAHRPALAG